MNVKPVISGIIVLALAAFPLFGFDTLIEEADEAHGDERYEESMELLDEAYNAASFNSQRAEVAWRRARTNLSMVDRDLAAETISDSEAIDRLEQGERYAEEAVGYNERLAEGWFWHAGNKGRRGQVRGVLNSLFMASDVRDLAMEAIERDEDMTEPYFLLGVMYRELPGGFISFGDDQKAVSLARLAVDRHEQDRRQGEVDDVWYNYYIELAHNLHERNWSESRRNRRQSGIRSDYESADENIDRAFNYEGTVSLPSGSDRDEAMELIQWVISEIRGLDSPTQGQLDDLAEAEELYDDWN